MPLKVVLGVSAVLAGQGAGEDLCCLLVQLHVPLPVELSVMQASSEGNSANMTLRHIFLSLLSLIITLVLSSNINEIYLLGCVTNHVALVTNQSAFANHSSRIVHISNFALEVDRCMEHLLGEA